MDAKSEDLRFNSVDPEMVDDLKLVKEMVPTVGNLGAFRHRPPRVPAHPVTYPSSVTGPLQSRMISGGTAGPDVPALIYDGAPGAIGRGALVWMHGGGFITGTASISPSLRMMADRLKLLIVSVDYRLSPEAPFPAALNDIYAVLRWVYVHSELLGVDRKRLAIGGESAGGGLAATLAVAARDRGEIDIAYQVLLYPMLDDRTGSLIPAKAGTGQFIWTAQGNAFAWSAYLGRPVESAPIPYGSVPARVSDLRGLPPAFIGVGTLDLFLNEDIEFAGRLAAAGIQVDLTVVPAAFHGFDGIAPSAHASRTFQDRWMNDLSNALSR